MPSPTEKEIKDFRSELTSVVASCNGSGNYALRGDNVFVDGQGKAVNAYEVLQHMEKRRKTLNECLRLLSNL